MAKTKTPKPGFYPDPAGTPNAREWDGTRWTENTQPLGPPPKPAKQRPGCLKIVLAAFVALVALVVVGLALGDKKTTKVTASAPSTVASSNDSSKPVATAADTSAEDTIPGVRGEPGEIADVKQNGKCTGSYGTASMPLLITNSSSKPSDYSVDVSFFDSDGVKIGDGLAYIQNVAPGAKAKDEAGGFIADKSRIASCKIVSVDRTAAV
jgi:Protein of unknown function (DUF2510)